MTIPSQDLPPLPSIDKTYDSQVHTHSSSITKSTPLPYDRLTTLGVHTLSLSILTILYTFDPDADVRVLTKSRDHFISAENVTLWGRLYELDTKVNVGYGQLPLRDDVRNTIAKEAFHARLGAAYLTDGVGLAGVVKFLEVLVEGEVERVMKGLVDERWDKTACAKLNERLSQMAIDIPEYARLMEEEDGREGFTVKCMIKGSNVATASGRTMKEAKQKAAAKVLAKGERFFNGLRTNVKRESLY
jgi:ribonuclease III